MLFTLFSKSFSSFPHGTCSLSVSQPYLVTDEIYHPVKALLPKNLTLKKQDTFGSLATKHRNTTFFVCLFKNNSSPLTNSCSCFKLQFNIHHKNTDFKSGLVPLHSPLLRKSLLFSFPPLNNMLKFSG